MTSTKDTVSVFYNPSRLGPSQEGGLENSKRLEQMSLDEKLDKH